MKFNDYDYVEPKRVNGRILITSFPGLDDNGIFQELNFLTQLSILQKEKWEYFTGKADPAVYQAKPFNLKILRQDVDKYINADSEIIKASQKVTYLKTIVDYLDKLIRQISNRTFTIKNAIEWRKFTSGAI